MTEPRQHRVNQVPSSDLTHMLQAAAAGDQVALNGIIAIVYDDLKAIALNHLRHERVNHTLQATALVNEAYLKLIEQGSIAWRDRVHFFATASQIIRHILVDHARARRTQKRGGERHHLTLEARALAANGEVDLVELDDALARLAEIDARQARIVELRYFGGLSINEVADVLAIGKRSVDRQWGYAKAWLYRALMPTTAESASGDGP